jgi:hypothetical protein
VRSPPAAAAACAAPASPVTPAAANAASARGPAFGSPCQPVSASAAPLGKPGAPPPLAFGSPAGSHSGALHANGGGDISFATPPLSAADAAAWRSIATPAPLRWSVPLDVTAAAATAAEQAAAADAAEEEEEEAQLAAKAAGCGGGPLEDVGLLLHRCGCEIEKATKASLAFVGFLFSVAKDKARGRHAHITRLR